MNRILVLRGGALGDFVLTLPAIEAVRSQWPRAMIELAVRSEAGALALECSLVERVHSLESAAMSRLFVRHSAPDPDLAAKLDRFDLAISFLHDPAGIVARNLEAAGVQWVLAGSPMVSGGHVVDHFLRILEKAGIRVAYGACPRLIVPAERLDAGRRWSTSIGSPVIVLHPGSGSRRKNWPLDRFITLAKRIRERTGMEPVFCTGEADGELAARLAREAEGFRHLAGMPLRELAAVLSAASAYVGNDSGITHLAAALGIPVVAVFGETDPAVWGPRGDRVFCVAAPAGVDDPMQRIPIDEVWGALVARL